MTSAAATGMSFSTVVFTVLAMFSFVVAGLVWQLALRNERMLTPAFDKPVRYDEGFSFTNTFTVAFTGVYWVEVVCPKTNLSGLHIELPTHIPVSQTVACDGKILAEGVSPNPDTGFYEEKVAYHTVTFSGESGKNYQVSFQNDKPIPALGETKPRLVIRLSQRVSVGNILLHCCTPSFACAISVLGLLFAISPCSFLVHRAFQRK